MGNHAAYKDPLHCPEQAPTFDTMAKPTQALHRRLNDRVHARGQAGLGEGKHSVSFDLRTSQNIVNWQEKKAESVFLDDACWSRLSPIYGRYGVHALQAYADALAELYGAVGALATCSGMTAVSTAFESFLEPAQSVVLVGEVYNKSRSLLESMTQRLGGKLYSAPYNDFDRIRAVLDEDTAFVFVETFTNPHMRALDLGAMRAALSEYPNALLVVDDTIATPWGRQRSLLGDGGADLVVGSGTKALAGNDSALSGYIVSARADLLNACMNTLATRGGVLDANTAQALHEGLDIARTRHAVRCASAEKVADFLSLHPKVADVYHPSMPTHPDHVTVERDYPRLGSLLSFRLKDGGEPHAMAFCDALATTGVFRYALSFDGLVSKVNHHRSVSEYFTPEEVCRAADLHELIRLAIGLEETDDLIACLNWALWHGGMLHGVAL